VGQLRQLVLPAPEQSSQEEWHDSQMAVPLPSIATKVPLVGHEITHVVPYRKVAAVPQVMQSDAVAPEHVAQVEWQLSQTLVEFTHFPDGVHDDRQ
jgi:hypothetical protein